MRTADGCTLPSVTIDGTDYARHLWRGMPRRFRDGLPPARCGDCATQPGHLHHLGCDLERCPRCGRQLISCGCLDDENDADY